MEEFTIGCLAIITVINSAKLRGLCSIIYLDSAPDFDWMEFSGLGFNFEFMRVLEEVSFYLYLATDFIWVIQKYCFIKILTSSNWEISLQKIVIIRLKDFEMVNWRGLKKFMFL